MNEIEKKLPEFIQPKNLSEAKVFINNYGRNMAEHAYIIGKVLIWIKGELKHGEFIEWIEKNVWFTRRTSHRFMIFAEKCEENGFLIDEPHYLEKPKCDNLSHLETPPLPEGKYFIVYADPPWQYSNVGFDESAEQQYPTMAVEEICALPVKDLIENEAVLFLWTTNAFIREGLDVCKAWGFEYKTNFVWIKNTGPSIGWFSKSRHELLFVATKGDGVHPKEKLNSWFEFKVGRHSQKPIETYEMIEKMYSGPYVELFARNKRTGWDSWGNEITR